MTPIGNFGWQDSPSVATPLDAANLEAFGAFVGAYSDANLAITAADVLGRTQVLGTATNPAPATLATVSVMDAPWSAKGDTRVATDGVVLIGTLNQVSSASISFTSADVGKAVVVLSVGANVAPGGFGPTVPGVLATTIASVAGGIATLNASATIPGTGLTVKVGTLDTTAINAAILAASNRATAQGGSGAVKIVFPSGRHFLFNNVVPKSNVLLDFTGATLHCASGNSAALSTAMMFKPVVNESIANWHIRGGTWVGTGTENGASQSQAIMYWSTSGFGGLGTATYTDISILDVTVTNWRTAVFDIRGGSRIRESNNVFKSCSQYAGLNTINVIMGNGASPVDSNDVFIQDNFFGDNGAEAIAIGEAGTPTGGFGRAVVTGNIIVQTGGSFGGTFQGATGIDVEWSTTTTGQCRDVIIANNVIYQNATPGGGSSWCISAGGSNQPANAHYHQRTMITDNICFSKDGGITVNSDDAVVEGNIISWGSTTGNTLRGLSVGSVTTISVTADTNSSTSLTNVVVNGGGVAENGMFLTGSGITAGTYLVSGAGGSTWTISLTATTTAAGNSLTGFIPMRRCPVTNNQIYTGALAANTPINIQQLADSRVADNLVYCEPGRTVTGVQTGASILVNKMSNSDVSGNRIHNASSFGIKTDSTANVQIERNRIYNPNQSAAASTGGISITSVSGLPFFIRDNYCWDDQSVHAMVRAIDPGSGMSSLAMLIGNDSRGATDANPFGIDTIYLLFKGNTGDQAGIPKASFALTLTGSVFTTTAVSYPAMLAVQGGTVTLIQHSRTGSSTRNVSSTTNVTAYLMPGDTISITYSVPPTVNVFPIQ